MIHAFKILETHYIYDVESGSLHIVDELVFALINKNAEILKNYNKKEISEATKEIAALEKDGSINCKEIKEEFNSSSDAIKSLCIHICHDCNLRCGYCFADEGKYCGERQMMSFETGKAAVDFLIKNSKSIKNLEMDFFGGEPLMNLDVLKEIVAYATTQAEKQNKVFKFTVTTNGVLLDKATSDYFNRTMDNVVLSIDGRKNINDTVRKTINGKGSYDLIVDNFKYFKSIRADKSYFVRGTFTANNIDFHNDVLHLSDLGFEQISIEPVVLPNENPLALKVEQLEQIKSNYELLTEEYISRRKSDKWFSFFHFNVDLENGPCRKKQLKGCGAGREYFAISANGDIYPCHQFVGDKNYILGNLHEEFSLKNNVLNTQQVSEKSTCSKCWAKYHCGGGCSANSIHFGRKSDSIYELGCELMKKRLECALHVFAHEKLSVGKTH